jgi:sec-independent protein translocase protein TatB
MFDLSWGEVVVIGVVALVVIGPKELPGVLRTVGQAVGKVRRMASEFQSQFQEAMREADMEEARKNIEGIQSSVASSFNPIQTIRDEIKGATEGTAAPATTEPPPLTEPAAAEPAADLVLPEPPPVPDLTPEQIQAAFAPEAGPLPPDAPAEAPAVEPTKATPHEGEPKAKA